MGLLRVCDDCKNTLESAMFEVFTEKPYDTKIFVHLNYCSKCDEYKGSNRNFQPGQERDAVLEEFKQMFAPVIERLGKVIDYKLRIPVKSKSK